MTITLPPGARLRSLDFTLCDLRFSVMVLRHTHAVHMHTPCGQCTCLDRGHDVPTLADAFALCVEAAERYQHTPGIDANGSPVGGAL